MTLTSGLVRARSHIVFVVALAAGFGLVTKLDPTLLGGGANAANPANAQFDVLETETRLPLQAPRALTDAQMEWGRTAWRYFERNINAETGLANATDGYPSTTMWDTGSFLMALIAAEELGVIDPAEFNARMGLALESLGKINLFDGRLPNKAYNVATLDMVDYNNTPSPVGIGYSALDIGRLMVPLNLVMRDHPDLTPAVRKVIGRWDFAALARGGELTGVVVRDGRTERLQEGRLGYEQYAARSLSAAFVDASVALQPDHALRFVDVEGVDVGVDSRDKAEFDADVHAVNEPYMLMALELGLDDTSRVLFEQIYKAQLARFHETGILTAASEGHLDRAPYFVYSTVWGNGEAWAVMDPDGNRFDQLRNFSSKSAFALDAILGTDYTARLLEVATSLSDPEKGWLEGRFETGEVNAVATANTNAVVLETLVYRQKGPIVLARQD